MSSIIYQQSWLTGEVPDDWKLANVTPIHKKGRKEDPDRPVSLTSVPGKEVEQFILSVIMQHLQDGQAIRPSQHGFRRGQSCLTNLVSFYDQVTCLVDAGRAVDVVYLDFSKAFDPVSHSTLLDKLTAYGLDRSTLCWDRNWLDGWTQRVVVNGAASSWGQSPVVSLRGKLGMEEYAVFYPPNGVIPFHGFSMYVLAAAVFAFRAVNLMEVTSLAAAEAVLADLSTLKVMPLLQIFLFATVT
ncbi:hypothetical protein DUI87_09349 [Hirundo rustica rustica]|uniref:Reverse transcriptase domain-containing protein n=1 Tax=Hirundo rustica rustica TaxID=333673 RepID=A0A3M0KLX1_HIRRU|nr:hypothetical protein DUI87_09349 [Hirundo rustica rustica]